MNPTRKFLHAFGAVTVRPYEERDIPFQEKYLFDSPKAALEEIGFDTAKFKPRNEWLELRLRVLAEQRAKGTPPRAAVAELDGSTIAMFVMGPDQGDGITRMHFHIFVPSLRGQGLGGPIFLAGLEILRELHGFGKALIQPKASNRRMNGLMRKLGFIYLGDSVREAGPRTQEMLVSSYEIP